ncbi:MAG: 3-dehydroquinate synthase family protein [Planctomycetota bacterium]
MTPSTVSVAAGASAYEVSIGAGVLETLGQRISALLPRARAGFVVLDANLPRSTKDLAIDTLRSAGLRLGTRELTPSETDKSVATWNDLLARFAGHRLERTDVVVAFGGGIVGDTAGFAAAAYRRGVPVIQCPTTLLAMVDASVGGKTGVNLPTGSGDLHKNFVGAFHQPAAVLADTSVLASLEPRDFACGLAECIKHTMIAGGFGDEGLGAWFDAAMDRIVAQDEAALTELVARNVALKAAVVATDERETATGPAGRALLNLGHTFGHAIETLPELGLLHGEAVGLGLVCAARYAKLVGSADVEATLRERLTRATLPTMIERLPPSGEIVSRMRDDKKAVGGRLRLVVPTGAATAEVVDADDARRIERAMDAIRP